MRALGREGGQGFWLETDFLAGCLAAEGAV